MKLATITPLALALTAGLSGTAFAAPASNESPAAHPGLVCLYPHLIRESKPISDTEILFTMADGKMWKNTLPANCPGLKFEGGFRWNIHGDEVCSNMETIYVLRRGNACMLGAFTAYTPPPKPAE